MKSFDVSGRAFGVTGAGGHLGQAMTLALVHAGAHVLALGRSKAPLDALEEASQGAPGRVLPFAADIHDRARMDEALDHLEEEAGPLRGWVNNAYSGGAASLMGGLDSEAVKATLDTGLAAVMTLTDHIAGRMQQGGAIVNIASMYGMMSPQPGAYRAHPQFHNPPAYGAAKAGILQFTRYAAVHLASKGIRVNAVSPGACPSPGVQEDRAFIEALEKRIPMGRIGEADEVAGSIHFLLSDASTYMTGHNLVVDGGWTIW